MTTHSISSGVNKQVLDETLAFLIFFFSSRLLFIYLSASRKEPSVINAARSHRCALLKQRSTARCPVHFLYFFTLLSGKDTSCHFPGGSLGQCLSVKGHHGAASDSFLSIRFFFLFYLLFFVSIVTTLLCCFTDFPAVLLRCLKLNAENL